MSKKSKKSAATKAEPKKKGKKAQVEQPEAQAPEASAVEQTPEAPPVEQAPETTPVEQIEAPIAEAAPTNQVETAGGSADTPSDAAPSAEVPKAGKRKKAKAPKSDKSQKMSAIDAAAKVLSEAGEPMNCQDMIKAMAEKGYWTSPGGQTPAATLYSAILREIGKKGTESRFKKTERGRFAAA